MGYGWWLIALALVSGTAPYRFFRVGSQSDVSVKPAPGFVLIGGGADVDLINRAFAKKAAGGDLLVLRASGGDAYDPYFKALTPLNSVETLIVDSTGAADDPFVSNRVEHAAAIFIAGGDQWNYLRFWNHSSLGHALRDAVRRGVPVAGTSAGLAVMGEYIFTAERDSVTSAQALRDPYDERVNIGHDFLQIAPLRNTITDSHFKARDRMGRSLVFLARILEDFHLAEARAIAIDERTAALMAETGNMTVAGLGHVYFLRAVRHDTDVCRRGIPLTLQLVEVYRTGAGASFNPATWSGQGGEAYRLSVSQGVIHSTQSGGSVY